MISKGDKVMLVWACCKNGRRHLGWIGIAGDIVDSTDSLCWCGYITHGKHVWIDIQGPGMVPESWLRKLPEIVVDKTRAGVENRQC